MRVAAHQQSVAAAFADRVAAHPERSALVFEERRLSYGELQAAIVRTAGGLRELGIGRGSTVAVMLPNGPEFVACGLALAWLGATMVPLNVKLKGDILAYQLGHAQPDAAIVGAELLEVFELARPANADPRQVVVGARGAPPAGWLGLSEVVVGAPDVPPARVGADELALVMYTSGTTGRPKGVMIGRQAQLRHGLNYTGLLGIRPGETAYVYLPLFHVTAMGSTLGSLLGGGTVALEAGFRPFGFWERCRPERAAPAPAAGGRRRQPGPTGGGRGDPGAAVAGLRAAIRAGDRGDVRTDRDGGAVADAAGRGRVGAWESGIGGGGFAATLVAAGACGEGWDGGEGA
jgi:acyl-CoA synthetase (AMP-forming)/AMP-acid ligase II